MCDGFNRSMAYIFGGSQATIYASPINCTHTSLIYVCIRSRASSSPFAVLLCRVSIQRCDDSALLDAFMLFICVVHKLTSYYFIGGLLSVRTRI